jgi:hypothetical protein
MKYVNVTVLLPEPMVVKNTNVIVTAVAVVASMYYDADFDRWMYVEPPDMLAAQVAYETMYPLRHELTREP